MTIDTYVLGVKLGKVDTAGVVNSVRQVENKIQSIDNKEIDLKVNAKSISAQINSAFKEIRLPALAVAGGGLAIGKNLINEAELLQESLNAVNVVFKQSADSVISFGQNASTSVGLAQSEFNAFAVKAQPLLRNAGLEGEELNKSLFDLTKRAADLGSIFNMDVDVAFDKLLAGLRGSSEPLDVFGANVLASTLQQEAMAQGIDKSVSKMSEQEKSALRLSVIMRQTSDTQGDFARTAGDSSNASRILSKQIKDQRAELGTQLLPIYSKVISSVQSVVNWFSNLDESTKTTIVNVGLITTAVSAFVATLGFIAPGVQVALKALSLITKTNPWILAITAGVAVVWDLYNLLSGGDSYIGSFIKSLSGITKVFDSIKEKINGAIDAVKNFFKTQDSGASARTPEFNERSRQGLSLRDAVGMNQTSKNESNIQQSNDISMDITVYESGSPDRTRQSLFDGVTGALSETAVVS